MSTQPQTRSNEKLTARFCETVTKSGRHGDGRGGYGLALNVKPTANRRISKSWTQRLRIGGKPTNIGLGPFPLVSLADARAHALDNAKMVYKGHDPRSGGMPALAEAIEAVIKLDAPDWRGGETGRSALQWRASLRDHVDAAIHAKRIDKITHAELFESLSRIWYEKPTTAKRIRQRLGRIMDWAVSKNYRTDNPASAAMMKGLRKARVKQQHLAALPFNEVPAAFATINANDIEPGIRGALELLILTASRSGDVRGARWSEFDLDGALWTIPGERMKAGEPHQQPLTDRAVEVLRAAHELTGGEGLAFPRTSGKPIGDAAFTPVLRKLGINATAHGFRTSFRVWATERSRMSEAAIEQQLAHKVTNAAQAAYDRSGRIDERREGMARWAQYLTSASAKVVSISA